MRSQVERAAAFRARHEDPPFSVPNPWDAGSARVLEAMGFEASGRIVLELVQESGGHKGEE